MVDPDPDVADAFAQIGRELLPQVGAATRHVPGPPLGTKDARLGQIARLHLDETSVQGIEFEQEAIGDLERADRDRTMRDEAQHRVGTVAMLVDEMLDWLCRATGTGADEFEARERVGGNVGVSGFHLAPGDRAVAVPVEPDCVLQVAQRDVPTAGHRLLADGQAEVAVAGLVRAGRGRQEDRQRRNAENEQPSH